MNATALWKNAALKTRKRFAYWVTLLSLFGLFAMIFGGEWYTARGSADESFALPAAWSEILSEGAGVAAVFGSVIIILLVASEFSWRTARQNVIDGLSKTEFFVEKLVQVPLVVVPLLAALVLIGGGFALAGTGSGGEPGIIRSADALLMGGGLLALVGYSTLALFFALLIRSSGAAMGVFFLYIAVVERLIGVILRWIDASLAAAARYFPTNIFNQLVEIEQYDPAALERAREAALEAGRTPPDLLSTPLLVGVALTYILVLVGVSFVVFERRDL